MTLLLDRRGLGVALRNDEPSQVSAVFAWHFNPCRLALVRAEIDLAVGVGGCEENPPPIIAHFHEVEVRPPLRFHADCRTQVDIRVRRSVRSHVAPPIEKLGLPLQKRALQSLVTREIDIVGDFLAVIDRHRDILDPLVGWETGVKRAASRSVPWCRSQKSSARRLRRRHSDAGRSSFAMRRGGRRCASPSSLHRRSEG